MIGPRHWGREWRGGEEEEGERRGGGGRGEVGRERREKREEEVVVPNLTAIECVPRRPSLTVLGEVSVEHRAEAVT